MLAVTIIDRIFLVYMLMLFARIISSWIPELQGTRVMQFISYCTDPYLNLFRRVIPPLGMLDISPIFAFLAMNIFEIALKALAVWLF
jgi:YggT family protein